jgi:glycosyltransferase involved in cell wall biosynthesis
VKKSYTEPLHLVVAGNKRYIGDDIYQLVSDLNIEKDVIFPGYFPEEDIQYLYRCAELLLFPSFYEGFGLPVLEAFASGIPVVTSTAGSLPEVGGDVALLADPDDPEEIAAGILALLSDHEFKERKRSEGLDWVKKFSWTKAAEETLKVFLQTV